MGRIRTVKPELFRHEGLYELEKETGLPIRIAWVGLFTACDRDGRFEWKPKHLKLDIMPWDDIEFSRVLDALASRGFIQKYSFGGEDFGFIPKWKDHQVINNRERASNIPGPVSRESNESDACSTREGNARGEGKGIGIGREKEKEKEKELEGKGSVKGRGKEDKNFSDSFNRGNENQKQAGEGVDSETLQANETLLSLRKRLGFDRPLWGRP